MMAFTLICGPLASLFQFFSLLFGFRLENPNEPSESERRIQEQQPKRHPKEHRRGEGGRRIKKVRLLFYILNTCFFINL